MKLDINEGMQHFPVLILKKSMNQVFCMKLSKLEENRDKQCNAIKKAIYKQSEKSKKGGNNKKRTEQKFWS